MWSNDDVVVAVTNSSFFPSVHRTGVKCSVDSRLVTRDSRHRINKYPVTILYPTYNTKKN
jgi:hypothetical protein